MVVASAVLWCDFDTSMFFPLINCSLTLDNNILLQVQRRWRDLPGARCGAVGGGGGGRVRGLRQPRDRRGRGGLHAS